MSRTIASSFPDSGSNPTGWDDEILLAQRVKAIQTAAGVEAFVSTQVERRGGQIETVRVNIVYSGKQFKK